MRSPLSSLISTGLVIALSLPLSYAVTYPVGTPVSEIPGGAYNTYFTNMFDICIVGDVLVGFTSTGMLMCETIPATPVSNATLSLSGSLVGTPNYVAKYTPTGTGINNSQIYDNGTSVGIATTTPGARLEVNGQVKITGGTPGLNRVLTSDATGLAYWSSSVAGATATGITGGVENYVSKFGVGGIGLYPSQFFDNGTNIGIGNATPGAKLDISGTIRISGGGAGTGKVLTSDASGLASWQPSVSTADFALSGAFWRQTGNSGTTSATDYVGTSDNQDLVFRRNLTEGMRLTGPSATLTTTRDASINSTTVGRGGGNIATNTVNGYNALYNNILGYQNTAIGLNTLYSNNTGFSNTAIGYFAGSNLTTGSNNIFIGYNTQPNISDTASNQLNIGNWIYGDNGNIGIGILAPTTRLDIAGSLRLVDGTQGTGKVLTSSPTGVASWQYPTAAASSSTLSLDGPLIGIPNYIAKYTPTGTGINISQIFDNGTNIGIGTNTPGAKLDLIGSLRIGGSGASLDYRPYNVACSAGQLLAWSGGVSNWICSNNAPGISGSGLITNYVTKWNGSIIANSQIFDSGTGVGIGTSTPGSRLEVAGQIRITGGSPGAGRILTSDATGLAYWSPTISGATATGITGGVENYISKFGTGGVGLYPSQFFDNGTNIGIGTVSPIAKLDVIGSTRITGDLTVQGKVITDTLVNRTVNNISVSGSLIPDAAAPMIYRDIGSSLQSWNNLYLAGQIKIGGGGPGVGRILTSDATGLAYWSTGFSGTTTATGITGGSGYYMPYFGLGGTGLYPTSLYYTGTRIGMNTINPQYMFDIRGSGSILNTGSGLCINDICIGSWAGLNNIVRSTGTPNYIAKFDSGGLINNSQLYETGGKLYIGDITGILGGSATLGYITVESLGATNSSNPMLTLSENGGQECRMWINGVNKMGSNCAWSAGVSGLGFLPNQIPRADPTLGDALTGSVMYNVGNFVGIGTNSPTTTLTVSGTVRITGGVPGVGKILTSDATGLAFWSSSLSGATATGIVGGVQNYVSKFGTGGNGLYPSQIFDDGTNIGMGISGSLSTKVVIDSGIANDSGLRLTRINPSTPLTANGIVAIGVNGSGKVVPISPISNIAVYTGTLRNSPPTPNPDLNTFNVSYDFNQYFAIPGKQSFVVSKGDGPSNNGPYFKENGTDALCSITGTYGGPGAYDCIDPDPVTGLSASPYNSFTMSAKGDTFGYQLALGARGDAPLFARSGRFNGSQTGGLYTNDSPFQTPAPWQRVLSVPANHPEYIYINTGLNSQLQAISGGGQVGIGTTFPDMRLVVANNAGSTSRIMQIKRGAQGADGSMITTYGTPYLGIGGLENRVNSLQTIGFGYSSVAGALRYAPAEIGFLTTSVLGNTQGDIVFANRASTTNVAPSEVMRITSAGSVGIGISSPGSRLDVNGAVRALGGSLFNGSNGYLFSSPGDTDGGMFSPADGTLVFATDNVERMRINSSGNIGIGTLTPSQLFQVTGTNAGILVGDSGSSAGALYFGNTAHGVKRNYNNVANDVGLYTAAANLQFSANGSATTQMTLTNAGNLGIGVSPTSKLDVAGTFELGTNGSQLNAMIKVAPTVDIVSIAASACLAQTFAVANATLGGVASISPGSALTDRMMISYARVSVAGIVEAKFCNESAVAIDLPSMIYNISVVQ